MQTYVREDASKKLRRADAEAATTTTKQVHNPQKTLSERVGKQ